MEDQAVFGSGDLFGVGSDVLATPYKFGTLEDVALDHSFTTKQQRGKKLYARRTGYSDAKMTGKAKFGTLNGRMINALYFGGTVETGRERLSADEAGTVPSAVAYTIVVANGANFSRDLGVCYADGTPFLKVAAGSEAAGAYSVAVATGTYTFDATDAGKAVLISYTWTDVTGSTVKLSNPTANIAKTFEVVLSETDSDGEFGVRLYACVSNKLALATKKGDFMVPEFDFEVQENAAGEIGEMFFE